MTQPDPSDIPVIVLCGGQGTRIREASEKLPKPMIDIGSQPILWHIMKLYGAHGFRRFILCLGYKSWDIKQYFLQYEVMMSDLTVKVGGKDTSWLHHESLDDWEVSLIDTGLETGTGGRIEKVGHLIDTDYFMVTYGDGLGDIDLAGELANLAASDLLGMVTGVHPTSRYGELGVVDDIVTNFAEKPPSEGWVSGGFFAFRREFLDYLPNDDPTHFFEHAPVQAITREKRLGLFPHNGFWMGMDTFREYTALNDLWARGEAPWKLW
ncbi:MAG: NTP transferase domain-containing protein [Actinomycetia bacterium]|nr:NTP transferase domain-containing protein [Actinomycetes bacterium]MCP4222080.1 NTP transferase domain-containing protein [Actinomycetes bacterium]MCP5033254.1 NTP transferase domain-containing protein [Actinomycetes bacterium]